MTPFLPGNSLSARCCKRAMRAACSSKSESQLLIPILSIPLGEVAPKRLACPPAKTTTATLPSAIAFKPATETIKINFHF